MRKRAYHIIISSLAKRAAIFLLINFLLSFSATALADMQLNPGEVQLNVGEILLDVDATSIIDDIAFGNDNFTVTMSPGNTFSASSADRKKFTVDPTTYVRVTSTCNSTKSSISLETTQTSGAITVTITPSTTETCTVSGGGGAGAGVGVITPTVILVPSEILLPPPEEIIAPPEIPAEILPPAEITPPEIPEAIEAPLIEIVEIPPAEEAPAVSVGTAVQAVQAISSGAVNIAQSVGGGIVQIFRGVTTGAGASGFIATNAPNIGTYPWDTDKPLTPVLGAAPLALTERGDYKITVRSAISPVIQDASNASFSFIKPKSASLNFRTRNPADNLMAQVGKFNNPSITILFPNGGEVLTVGENYNIVWTWKNLPEPHEVNISIATEFDIADSVKKINTEVKKAVEELRSDPVVTQTVKEVAVPISVGVTVASAGAVTVTASAGSATIAINLSELLQSFSLARFYLLGLVRFKRKKPWGKVYEKLTGNPIRSATVQIYDAEYKKIKDTQITDSEGRFSSLISIGKYYLKVSKNGFETEESGIITITSPDQILNIEMALSPIREFNLEYLKKINLWNTIKRLVELINPYLLAFGTIVSIIAAVIVPNTLNYITLIVYIALDIFKIYLAFHLIKPFGKVIDQITQKTLPLSVVRIFNEEKNWLLATKVADDQGRFDFLLAPGKYYLTCTKAGYAPFRSDTITLTKAGLAAIDIKLAAITEAGSQK